MRRERWRARWGVRELRKVLRMPPRVRHLLTCLVMLVCERDWILLRARLRCFVALTALPRMTSAHLRPVAK